VLTTRTDDRQVIADPSAEHRFVSVGKTDPMIVSEPISCDISIRGEQRPEPVDFVTAAFDS
jgi:hypothetical protein